MKKKKIITRLIVLIMALTFISPTVYAAYSAITGNSDITKTVIIPQEVQDIISQSDPENFDKNINNYKNLLIELDVHQFFKDRIEELLKAGHKLSDILISYEFLNDSFGELKDLETLMFEKESGKDWKTIFKAYNDRNPEFVPSSFEPEHLEKLMSIPEITADDIMIADRVAQKLGKPISDIINHRVDGMSWKNINAGYGVLNAQAGIPHVSVTPEQIDKYTEDGMEREKVILAFVIAMKMEKDPNEIIEKIRSGETKEQIYATYYLQKYE